MDTLLIVGGRPDTVRKAKALGLRVLLLQHKELFNPVAAEHAEAVILADYTDWAVVKPLVEAAHQVWSFTRVVSLVDQAMEIVGRINDLFGLEGTPYEVSHRFRNKLAMRRHLAAVGLETVTAEPVRSPDEVRVFGARHGWPVVLKPTNATASIGVVVIPGPARVDELWATTAGLRGHQEGFGKYYPVDQLMAEEYIDGKEYAVETFSFNGRHVAVAVTDKLCSGVVEIGHAVPAQLPADEEAEMLGYVSAFLGAMGLRDGIASTEIKMSSKGPRIIESQDRVTGDRVMDLVELAHGFDLERYAVGWPFGLVDELRERPPARRGAATRFLLARSGTVTAVEGRSEVEAHPGFVDLEISVDVGAEVSEFANSFDRIGQLLTTGADTAEAVRVCDDLLAKIQVRTAAKAESAEVPA